MFIFGWGGNNKILGDVGINHCDNCKNISLWQVIESSKRATVYFIPIVKWGRKYFCLCSVCSYGYELEDRQKAQDLLLAAHQEKEQHKIHVAGHQNVAPDTAEEIGRSQPARKNDPYKGNRDRSGSTHAANNESAAENEKDSPLEIEDDDPLELEDIPIVAEVREDEGNKKEKDNNDEPKEGRAQTGFEKVVLATVAVSILFLVLIVLVNLPSSENGDKRQVLKPTVNPQPSFPPPRPRITDRERALGFYRRKEYQRAEHHFSLHLSKNRDDAAAYVFRGDCRREIGKFSSAATDYEQAVERNPRDTDTLIKLSRIYESNGQYSQAIRVYSRLIAVDSGISRWHEKRGDLFQRQQQYRRAIDDYARAIKENPNQIHQLYKKRARLYLANLKQYDKAIADYSVVLSRVANDYESYLWRGFCYIKQKKYDPAHADLTFLIKHKERLFQSHKYRGIIWFNEKKYDYAKEDFSEALKHKPPSRRALGEAHYFLSQAYGNTGDNALANRHLSLAAENGFKK